MFTRNQIEEIKQKLLLEGIKDSQLPIANTIDGNEMLPILQKGSNKRVFLQTFMNKIAQWTIQDIINISKNNEVYSLQEAVKSVGSINHKIGQMITFIERESNEWRMYQFHGQSTNDWYNLEYWKNQEKNISDLQDQLLKVITWNEETDEKVAENANKIEDLNTLIGDNKNIIDNYTINGYKVSSNPKLTKVDVGLSNVDNTADKDKPISTATSTALAKKADLSSGKLLDTQVPVDEEDVTVTNGKIKLKDRDTTNGMGYKILRRPSNGILTQSMINDPNTIYEIRYNFDLNGAIINIPENCTLKFEGGKLNNGIVQGNNTNVEAENYPIFLVDLKGSLCCDLTPNWFGAIGDGVVDDTNSLRRAIVASDDLKCKLCFPEHLVYKVSGPLNYINSEYKAITLNLEGTAPKKINVYSPTGYGGIKMVDNTNLFQGANIKGTIESLIISGVRSENVHVFDNCQCYNLVILNSTISNVGAVFFDSSLHSGSRIGNNTFLTAFYFHRNVDTNSGITDSSIYGNYINGGEELTGNSCFEFAFYNGSLIRDNFIDYYRTIYTLKASSNQGGGCINSVNNQYQVFKYFYTKKTITNFSISSVGDCFNWTNPEKLNKLKTYESITYTGRDNQEYQYPPYIIKDDPVGKISFINSVFEQNIGKILLLAGEMFSYSFSQFRIESPIVYSGSLIPQYLEGSSNPVYNGGTYKSNKIIELPDESAEIVEELPTLTSGWSSRAIGHKVLYKNNLYIAQFVFDSEGLATAMWVPRNVNVWKIIR